MSKNAQNHRSLTVKSNVGILRVLTTPVRILIPSSTKFVEAKAIWDTGATGSVITTKVVQALALAQTGAGQMHTANGVIADGKTYTIDMALPNGVVIQSIIAGEVPALSGGAEVLIGMDVITMGDFSITNHNGTTCMSFRVPSQHEIDYVTNPNYGITPIKHLAPGSLGSNLTPKKKKRK